MTVSTTDKEYYENPEFWGEAQYVTLESVLDNIILLASDDSYLKKVKRFRMSIIAKQGLKRFALDIKQEKRIISVELGANKIIAYPRFMNNWSAISYVNEDGCLEIIDVNTKSPVEEYLQEKNYELLYDVNGEVLEASNKDFSCANSLKYVICEDGKLYKADEEETTWVKDVRKGSYFEFSDSLVGKEIIIEFQTNGLDKLNDCDIKVHSVLEEALSYYIKWKTMENQRNVPRKDVLDNWNFYKLEKKKAARYLAPKISINQLLRSVSQRYGFFNEPPKLSKVKASSESERITDNINVPELPTASAGVYNEITLPVNTISLLGNGNTNYGAIKSYLWIVPNGVTINDNSIINPIITINASGIYSITLIVTYYDNKTGTDTVSITVNPIVDTLPPTTPTGLNVLITGTSSEFTWDESTDDVDTNLIYRYEATCLSGVGIGNTRSGSGNDLIFNSTGLDIGYWEFKVRAEDNTGKFSDYAIAYGTVQSLLSNSVAYYKFNEASGSTLIDSLAIRNGQYVNSPTLFETGIIGNAVRFNNNASNQYAAVTSSQDLSIIQNGSDVPFSISLWVKPSSTTGYLVGKTSDIAGDYEWEIILVSGKLRFNIYSDGLSTSKIVRNANTSLSLSTWYNIICTYDGSGTIEGVNIYLNNINDNSGSSGVVGTYNGVAYTSSPLRISNDEDNTSVFNGIIDELCIWKNRELSQSEVTLIYNNGNGLELS